VTRTLRQAELRQDRDQIAIDGAIFAAICSSFVTAFGLAANIAMLGSNRMKKIAFVLAAAGLMSVAACTKSPEAAAVENNAEMVADNLEMGADNLEAAASNTADAITENAGNVADNLNAAADNVREAADAKVDNM
jgi:hypothetical protein